MYTSAPSAGEMAAAGLTEEDFGGFETELLPENLPAYELFGALGTQWRIGAGGPTGLDYGVVPVTMRLRGMPRADWPELFEDLRVMERAALEAMANRE